MRASDLYGPSFGQPSTQDTTQPQQSTVAASAANEIAKKGGVIGTGVLAIVVMIGILLGTKYALEKR